MAKGGTQPGAGRPVALNETWLAVAEEVISTPWVVIAWTDEDIVEEINDKLRQSRESNKMISLRSYQRYKKLVVNKTKEEALEEIPVDLQILIDRFWRVIKKQLRQQKLNILANFAAAKQRQKRARIYERKFNKDRGLPKAGGGDDPKGLDDDHITEVEVIIKRPEETAIE